MRAFTLTAFAAVVFGLACGTMAGPPAPQAATVAEKVIPKVALDGMSLERSVAFLGQATGASIEVDWGTLRTAGVTRQSKVNARADELPLAKALDLAVAGIRGATEPISWFIHKDTFIITTQATLLRLRLAQAEPVTLRGRSGRAPAPPAAAPAAKGKPLRGRTLGKVEFEEAPLEEALLFFRDVADINMVVHWQALAVTGVNKQTPVTIKLADVEFTRALDLVLGLVNADKDQYSRVYWVSDDGVLKITTGAVLDSEMLTRVYPVGDLLVVAPNFSGPSLSLHGSRTDSETSSGGGTGIELFRKDLPGDTPSAPPSTAEQKEKLKDSLIKAIMAATGPELWQSQGGKGTIQILRDQMIITQSRLGFKLMTASLRRR